MAVKIRSLGEGQHAVETETEGLALIMNISLDSGRGGNKYIVNIYGVGYLDFCGTLAQAKKEVLKYFKDK
jgi:hypothetical protein